MQKIRKLQQALYKTEIFYLLVYYICEEFRDVIVFVFADRYGMRFLANNATYAVLVVVAMVPKQELALAAMAR